MRSVVWFAEVGVADVATVGGKGANLGELTGAGLPVPPGFVITSEAYLDAIERTGTRAKLGEILKGLDPGTWGTSPRSPNRPNPWSARRRSRRSWPKRCSMGITSLATGSGWRCAPRVRARTPRAPRSPA